MSSILSFFSSRPGNDKQGSTAAEETANEAEWEEGLVHHPTLVVCGPTCFPQATRAQDDLAAILSGVCARSGSAVDMVERLVRHHTLPSSVFVFGMPAVPRDLRKQPDRFGIATKASAIGSIDANSKGLPDSARLTMREIGEHVSSKTKAPCSVYVVSGFAERAADALKSFPSGFEMFTLSGEKEYMTPGQYSRFTAALNEGIKDGSIPLTDGRLAMDDVLSKLTGPGTDFKQAKIHRAEESVSEAATQGSEAETAEIN